MSKLKVIDLLNIISKSEEVPKKIKYKTWTFIYVDEFYGYMKENYLEATRNEVISFMAYIVSMEELNDEVEIIEEKKIPEKLLGKPRHIYNENELYIVGKVNEIIDYLESKGE